MLAAGAARWPDAHSTPPGARRRARPAARGGRGKRGSSQGCAPPPTRRARARRGSEATASAARTAPSPARARCATSRRSSRQAVIPRRDSRRGCGCRPPRRSRRRRPSSSSRPRRRSPDRDWPASQPVPKPACSIVIATAPGCVAPSNWRSVRTSTMRAPSLRFSSTWRGASGPTSTRRPSAAGLCSARRRP